MKILTAVNTSENPGFFYKALENTMTNPNLKCMIAM